MCPEWVLRAIQVSLLSGIAAKWQPLNLNYKAEYLKPPPAFRAYQPACTKIVDCMCGCKCASFLLLLPKSLQTQWFKTMQTHYFIVLQVRILTPSQWAEIQMSAGLHSLLEALREKSVPLPFSASRGCLHSLAPSSTSLSSVSKARNVSSL